MLGTIGSLVADSSETTGVKWAAAPGPSYAWTTWTPTLTGITLGNGTMIARYAQVDKIVYVFWRIVGGSTTTWSNNARFTLPVNYNRQASIDLYGIGGGAYYDSSATTYYHTSVYIDATTAFLQYTLSDATVAKIVNYNSSNSQPADANTTTNDVFYAQFWYEVA